MHNSRVEKVPTESQGDEAPIIHSVQAPSADADVARASRLSATNAMRVTLVAPRFSTWSQNLLTQSPDPPAAGAMAGWSQAEGLGGLEVTPSLAAPSDPT